MVNGIVIIEGDTEVIVTFRIKAHDILNFTVPLSLIRARIKPKK